MGVYKNNNGNLQLISGATLYADAPVGSISAFGGSEAPSGWLLCQGQAVSRTTYAELFSIIGTSFGSGDGSTTFNVPDLRGEFLRGAGTNSHANQGNGGSVGEHQDGTGIPNAYANNYSKVGLYLSNKSTADYNLLAINKDSTVIQSAAYLEAITTDKGDYTADAAIYTARPTNTSVNYIIKAQQVALPVDFESALDSKQDATDNTLDTSSKTITGAINELNTGQTDVVVNTSGIVITSRTDVTFMINSLVKVGKLRIVSLAFMVSNNVSDSDLLANLSSDYPALSIFATGKDALDNVCSLAFNPDGSIRAWGTIKASNSWYPITAIYLVQ